MCVFIKKKRKPNLQTKRNKPTSICRPEPFSTCLKESFTFNFCRTSRQKWMVDVSANLHPENASKHWANKLLLALLYIVRAKNLARIQKFLMISSHQNLVKNTIRWLIFNILWLSKAKWQSVSCQALPPRVANLGSVGELKDLLVGQNPLP